MRQVQEALASTKIPAYVGTFRATDAVPKPPKTYCAYTTMTREMAFSDDDNHAYETFVYLNLWTTKDPEGAISKIRSAMKSYGFHMEEEREEFDEETGLNLVVWTWVWQEDVPEEA